ncbi:MAG: hypothetical protein AAF362_08195, partial [Pseudomonadota bacterium]
MKRPQKPTSSSAFAQRVTPQLLFVRAFIAFVLLIGSVLIVQFTWTAAKAGLSEISSPPAVTAPAPELPETGIE